MTDRDEQARLRAQEHHSEFEIRREEQAMARQERRLAHAMEELIGDEEHAEHDIESEIIVEHWGKQPERPLAWKDPEDTDPS
jgi:hypothetical protein